MKNEIKIFKLANSVGYLLNYGMIDKMDSLTYSDVFKSHEIVLLHKYISLKYNVQLFMKSHYVVKERKMKYYVSSIIHPKRGRKKLYNSYYEAMENGIRYIIEKMPHI